MAHLIKTCKKCFTPKEPSEFHAHKQAAGQVPFIPEHDINLTGKGGIEKLVAEGVLQ